MAGRRIEVQVFPEFRRELSVPWLRHVAEQALSQETSARTHIYPPPEGEDKGGGRSPSRSLSLVIADDETVRRLNHDYRGLDETTDVLAFAFDHPGEYQGDDAPPLPASQEPFITAPEDDGFAGEVIVSYPQCLRQATAQGHSPHDELALLITHGVLHLLGHDHATPEEEQAMKSIEQKTLATLGMAEARP